jgi:hypothetical protein
MRSLFRRAPRPAPAAPVRRSPEADLLDACERADAAMAALGAALADRRRALRELWNLTDPTSRALINRAMTPWAVGRALWFHGIGEAAGLPHLPTPHQGAMVPYAQSLLRATDSGRWTSEPEPDDPVPAESGELQEAG